MAKLKNGTTSYCTGTLYNSGLFYEQLATDSFTAGGFARYLCANIFGKHGRAEWITT